MSGIVWDILYDAAEAAEASLEILEKRFQDHYAVPRLENELRVAEARVKRLEEQLRAAGVVVALAAAAGDCPYQAAREFLATLGAEEASNATPSD